METENHRIPERYRITDTRAKRVANTTLAELDLRVAELQAQLNRRGNS